MKILIDTHIFLWLANDSLEKMKDFDARSALRLATLPFHHRDPFDRMIISQALTGKLTIFSVDRKFKLYDCKLLQQ